MKHADVLSRSAVMNIIQDDLFTRIRKAQTDDPEIQSIINALKDQPQADYQLRGGLLFKYTNESELLVVPKFMQDEIIQMTHRKGHLSAKRTEELIKAAYYIPELNPKVVRFIANCLECILANKKGGKQEGYLHPLPKPDVPLHTYHVDHLGPLESTSKKYNHIFAVIDAYTKFVWLYPTKSTASREVITKLDLQGRTFGNPAQIVTDRGTAFTSQEFESYCKEESIKHILVTTGLPRANGQVERINRTIIPILTKLSMQDPTKWYLHVDRLQQTLNSTYQRSINTSPLELLTGVKMRTKQDLLLKEVVEEMLIREFIKGRDELREKAKQQIIKTQEENRRTYNLRRREPNKYKLKDIVAIKRTQMGPGRKLRAKYLGPYQIEKVKYNDTYDVKRVVPGDGPMFTSTCAEYMKPWVSMK